MEGGAPHQGVWVAGRLRHQGLPQAQVAEDDEGVPGHPDPAWAGESRPRVLFGEGPPRKAEEVQEVRVGQMGLGPEGGKDPAEAAPGAGVLAEVAPQKPVPHPGPEAWGDEAPFLNGEIADADAGVQGAVSQEGPGGAGLEAADAAAATGGVVGRRLRLQGGEEHPDEGVHPEGLGEEHATFPHPARPRKDGQGPLGKGAVVHVASGLEAQAPGQGRKRPQGLPQDQVVVPAPGVAGYPPHPQAAGRPSRVLIGVGGEEEEGAFGPGKALLWPEALLRPPKVGHPPVPPRLQPGPKPPFGLLQGLQGSPGGDEAHGPGGLLQKVLHLPQFRPGPPWGSPVARATAGYL